MTQTLSAFPPTTGSFFNIANLVIMSAKRQQSVQPTEFAKSGPNQVGLDEGMPTDRLSSSYFHCLISHCFFPLQSHFSKGKLKHSEA